jgi:hypothetical protein
MGEHVMHNGACILCGCDINAVKYFGWICSGRTSSHIYRKGICSNHGKTARTWRWDQFHTTSAHCMDNEKKYAKLLGLKGRVTRDDIKSAYREQAGRYHPDRVAHLGPEIQAVATERMKEINLAFAFFRKKYSF